MTEKAARLIFGAVVIFAILRVAPTAAGARDLMLAGFYILAAVCCVAVALSVAEKTVIDFASKWRVRTFDACGILHADGRPCLLPDGHRCTEHATAWLLAEPHIEARHRFDDTGDRVERRAARGQLPPVSRTGDVVATVGK